MSNLNHQFPFYLRIGSKGPSIDLLKGDSTPNTIYSSFHYPKDSTYRIATSINPCNSVLLSNSKELKGSAVNKKLVNKDDLYQYRLNHNETSIFQFSFVFSELLSNDFITNALIKPETKTQNVFVFGSQKKKFITQLLTGIMRNNTANKLELSFYSFDRFTKDMRLIHPSLRNIAILSSRDISSALLNMSNEYKLSMINMPKRPNDNTSKAEEEKIIIVAAKRKGIDVKYNFISISLLSANGINDIVNAGFNYPSAVILNVQDQSDDDLEKVAMYHSMFAKHKEEMSESSKGKTESKLYHSKRDPNNQIEPRDSNDLYKQANKSPKGLKDKTTAIHNNNSSTPNLSNDHLQFSLQNECNYIKQQNLLLEKLNKKLTSDLEQERKEKLNYINENGVLAHQIAKLQNELAITASNLKSLSLSLSEQKMHQELKERESTDRRAQDDQIKALIEEKSYIEVEYQILKEKYQDISVEYKEKQLQYEESNKLQELNLKEIEEKVYRLDIELQNFQKDNISLQQINQRHLSQIETINQQKEKYYNKSKLLKKQLSINSYIKDTPDQSQNKLIETLKSKIKQINTDSLN